MKKLAILSPLVLLATTALAQDSTCILQPSCSQLGYTSAEADCGTAKVLRCPFDVSQVACLSGGSDGGSGAGGDNYNPNDPNNELGDVIALKINVSAAGSATFTYGGGSIYVDCGEGTLEGGSALSSGTVSCSYTEIGDYTVKLSGDFTYFGGVSGNGTVAKIIKLDKSGITKMSKVCGSTTNGVVPPLPSTLVNATSMFNGCKAINSPYPKLPATLEVADNMFNGAAKFTGSVALPESLKSAKAMFNGASGLTSITGLENTKITDGANMFAGASSLTSIDGLPSTLTTGTSMFKGSKIAGTIALPATLTDATYMFYGTGAITITGLENTKIVDGKYMFANSGVKSYSGLPTTLTTAQNMFMNASSLTAATGLGTSKITDGTCMFYKCSSLASLPTLPSTLTKGITMFRGCTSMTGTLTTAKFPSNLTNGTSMFRDCTALKATNITRPTKLTTHESIFTSSTGITYDDTWTDDPEGTWSGSGHSCS